MPNQNEAQKLIFEVNAALAASWKMTNALDDATRFHKDHADYAEFAREMEATMDELSKMRKRIEAAGQKFAAAVSGPHSG